MFVADGDTPEAGASLLRRAHQSRVEHEGLAPGRELGAGRLVDQGQGHRFQQGTLARRILAQDHKGRTACPRTGTIGGLRKTNSICSIALKFEISKLMGFWPSSRTSTFTAFGASKTKSGRSSRSFQAWPNCAANAGFLTRSE